MKPPSARTVVSRIIFPEYCITDGLVQDISGLNSEERDILQNEGRFILQYPFRGEIKSANPTFEFAGHFLASINKTKF